MYAKQPFAAEWTHFSFEDYFLQFIPVTVINLFSAQILQHVMAKPELHYRNQHYMLSDYGYGYGYGLSTITYYYQLRRL